MPVAELDEIIEPVLRAFHRSHVRVNSELAATLADPEKWRRTRRLRELSAAIEAEMGRLAGAASAAGQAATWANELGFATGAVAAGGRSIQWSLMNREAVDRLARGLYDDLLSATGNVTDSAKRLLRRIGRDLQLQKFIEGKTAVQLGQEMTRLGGQAGVFAVRYANGALVSLDTYAEMSMRTLSGVLYNEGLIAGARTEGCDWFECFDGPDCGLEWHDDPTVADGMVADGKLAGQYPISHPNCRRSWGARPDVTNADEAADAERSTTLEQREAQIRADLARQYPLDRIRAQAAAEQQVRPRAPSVADPRGYRAGR